MSQRSWETAMGMRGLSGSPAEREERDDECMNAQQAWIRQEIFRVAAAARELPTDSAEHGAAMLLVTRMWDAFHEAVHA